MGIGRAGRSNHNKAACALANKLARICYATLRDKEPFAEGAVPLAKKDQPPELS
jgi:transposase